MQLRANPSPFLLRWTKFRLWLGRIHRSHVPEHLSFGTSRLSRPSRPSHVFVPLNLRRRSPTSGLATSTPPPWSTASMFYGFIARESSQVLYMCHMMIPLAVHPFLITFASITVMSTPSSPTTPHQCPTCRCLISPQRCKSNKNGNRGRIFVSCYRRSGTGSGYCDYFQWLKP